MHVRNFRKHNFSPVAPSSLTNNKHIIDFFLLFVPIVVFLTNKNKQSVGIEIEFCLVNAATGTFVDNSVFANTDTLNDQEEFLTELCDQLERQYIEVELLHAAERCGGGLAELG